MHLRVKMGKSLKEGTVHYIGLDYHKKYSYMVVKNREGKVERRGKVENIKEEFLQLLKPRIESCNNGVDLKLFRSIVAKPLSEHSLKL